MRSRAIVGALALLACDPLLLDPRLPEQVTTWSAPAQDELRGRVAPVEMAGAVDGCASLSDLSWTIDDRPMRIPLAVDGAEWSAEVPVDTIVGAVGFESIALPEERPGTWRVQATCDDFGTRIESPPRAVLVSPFEAVANAGAEVEGLLVSDFGEGRPAIFALSTGDLRQMDASRGCVDDVPAEAELSSCWQSWSARPSGIDSMHRLDGRIALRVACSDFDGGRLCPPGFTRGLVFFDEKFDADLRIDEPNGCDLHVVQVSLQRLYVLSVCDDAETQVEPIDVVDEVGGVRITRLAPVTLPGRVFAYPARVGDAQVGYARRSDGRIERWTFGTVGATTAPTAVSILDARTAATGSDGSLLVTVGTTNAVEIRHYLPDLQAPVASWAFDRPDVYGQMFGAEPWARSADELWSLRTEEALPVDLQEGTRWQLVAGESGVFAVLGGPAIGVGPARVMHAEASGSVVEVLPELELAMQARLRRAGDRIYGALGAYVFTLNAARSSPRPR